MRNFSGKTLKQTTLTTPRSAPKTLNRPQSTVADKTLPQMSTTLTLTEKEKKSKKPSSADETNSIQCKGCKRLIKRSNIVNHILIKHTEIKSVECAYCDFRLSFNTNQVKKHIQEKHPGENPDNVIDNRRKYEPQLKKLRVKFFGAAPKSSK